MTKATPLFLQKITSKPTKTKTLSVGLDVFGNAIPEVKSALVEGTGKALRIVRRQEVIVKPSRKQARVKTKAFKQQSTEIVPVSPVRLSRLIPWTKQAEQTKQTRTKASVETSTAKRKQDDQAHPEGIGERLEYAFHRLHQEFNEREQQLEVKMQELKEQHENLLAGKTKKRLWLAPVVVAAVGVVGYMMYVMTSMQTSMTAMSGNINTMNGHMGTMAGDTQVMSQNVQTMNQSMYYMNNNVAYMSGNVAQMNQQVGAMARAAAPMGEAASTMSPFMKMFKSFMPF